MHGEQAMPFRCGSFSDGQQPAERPPSFQIQRVDRDLHSIGWWRQRVPAFPVHLLRTGLPVPPQFDPGSGNQMDSRLAGREMGTHHAGDRVTIGDPDGRRAERRGRRHQFLGMTRAAKKGEVARDHQVDEGGPVLEHRTGGRAGRRSRTPSPGMHLELVGRLVGHRIRPTSRAGTIGDRMRLGRSRSRCRTPVRHASSHDDAREEVRLPEWSRFPMTATRELRSVPARVRIARNTACLHGTRRRESPPRIAPRSKSAVDGSPSAALRRRVPPPFQPNVPFPPPSPAMFRPRRRFGIRPPARDRTTRTSAGRWRDRSEPGRPR